jgi:RNA polymerase sigma factor (sigma-70 family)
MNSSDRDLLRQFVEEKREAAFEKVVSRYAPMVLGVCRRILQDSHAADDVFQAVFLVVAKKASSLLKQESIARWLYRVTVNTALDAKSSMLTRAKYHQKMEEINEMQSEERPTAETGSVIDEEIDRLPKKYRSVIILCCLEGLSYETASKQLGLSFATLKMRLKRGRELLRTRLIRQGITVTPAALAFLTENTSAAVSNELMKSTIQTAMSYSSGSLATGFVPSQVIALAQGSIRALLWQKLMIAGMVMLILVGSGVAWTFLSLKEKETVALPTSESKSATILRIENKAASTPQEKISEIQKSLNEALIRAVKDGKIEEIRDLLTKGADIHVRANKGMKGGSENWPLLAFAVEEKNLEIAKLLIEKGADVNAKGIITKSQDENEFFDSILAVAVRRESAEIVELLVSKGADVHFKGGNENLCILARARNLETVRFLLSHGEYDKKELSQALVQAAAYLSLDVLMLLKGSGAHFEETDGPTALVSAIEGRRLEAVKFVLNEGVDINAKLDEGWTPLLKAAERGSTDIFKWLIENGADIHARNESGSSVMMLVASRNKFECVKLLLEKGVDLTPDESTTAFLNASIAELDDKLATIKLLISKGADINAKDEYGRSAVRKAIQRGHSDLAMFLLDKGTVLDSAEGAAVLRLAVERVDFKIVKSLLKGSAFAAKDMPYALSLAAQYGDLELVKFFIQKGADVNCLAKSYSVEEHEIQIQKSLSNPKPLEKEAFGGYQSMEGDRPKTPLMRAVVSGRLEIAKFLIEHGANINAKQPIGESSYHPRLYSFEGIEDFPDGFETTVLHESARRGNIEVVKLLLEKGADVNVRDSRKQTVLSLVLKNKQKEISELLQKHGATE